MRFTFGFPATTFAFASLLTAIGIGALAAQPTPATMKPSGAVLVEVSTTAFRPGQEFPLSRLRQLNAAVDPASDVKWASNAPSILQVTPSGTLKALRAGVAVLVPYRGATPPTLPPYTAYQCDSKKNSCHCTTVLDCRQMERDGVCVNRDRVSEDGGVSCPWRNGSWEY